MKTAPTSVVTEIAGAQAPPPPQAPRQPENWNPGLAFGTSVTVVATGKDCSQSSGQAMPAGSLETSPPPWTLTSSSALLGDTGGAGGRGGATGTSIVQRYVSRAV